MPLFRNSRVEDVVPDIAVDRVRVVSSVFPSALHLFDKSILVAFSALLDLRTLVDEVLLETVEVPVSIGGLHSRLPVVLHKVLKILAISRSRVWDVMVGKPALKLGLVPFVVS